MVKYQIRQAVRNIQKQWLDVLFETTDENTARFSYQSMRDEHPNEYFELVKIEHTETHLEWTNKTI